MNEAVPKPQGRTLADLAALHKQLARLAKITQRGASEKQERKANFDGPMILIRGK